MKRVFCLLAVAALALAGCDPDETEITSLTEPTPKPAPVPLPDLRQTRIYDVTIENLTNAQPFSPGVAVTHTAQLDLYEVGMRADTGIALIAESGQEQVAAARLQGRPGAFNVMRIETHTPPMNFPTASNPQSNRSTVRVTAGPGVDRLSLAVMLTCTNDGFTGLDGVALPLTSTPAVFTNNAFDAGVEVNNELSPFIVEPCHAFGPVDLPVDGNRLAPENLVIRNHPGIQGTGDLPAIARWTAPVIRVTVQRVGI